MGPPVHTPEKIFDSDTDVDRCATLNDPTASAMATEDDGVPTSRFIRLRSSRNFLSFTVALAIFVDLLCYGIIMPLTPFIVERLGLKSTANGALIACYAIGLLISSPVAGIISDRMANRRAPMVVGLVCLLLSTVCFMEAMNYFWVRCTSLFNRLPITQ